MELTRRKYIIDFATAGQYDPFDRRTEVSETDWLCGVGNAIGSRLASTGIFRLKKLHAPVIDIDYPCKVRANSVEIDVKGKKEELVMDSPFQLVESCTRGHFHLYIEQTLTWNDYIAYLESLYDRGIIGPAYLEMAYQRGETFVRRPGVKKGASVSEFSG